MLANMGVLPSLALISMMSQIKHISRVMAVEKKAKRIGIEFISHALTAAFDRRYHVGDVTKCCTTS